MKFKYIEKYTPVVTGIILQLYTKYCVVGGQQFDFLGEGN